MAKVLVSVDDALLVRIDSRARQLGLTRSAFFARIASDELASVDGPTPRATAAVERIRAMCADAANDAVPGDSTDFIRAMRDAR